MWHRFSPCVKIEVHLFISMKIYETIKLYWFGDVVGCLPTVFFALSSRRIA